MPYFIKYTLNGRGWSWCYAAGVTRSAGAVVVTQPLVPFGGEAPRVLFNGRLSWADGSGLIQAYPLAPRPWIQAPAEVKLPRSLPEPVRAGGLRAAVAHVLRGSYLARLFASPAVRRAVAEDRLLEEASSWLHQPFFVPADDRWLTAWTSDRPAAARHAAEDADRVVKASGLTGIAAAQRALIRREAHRKLDAAKENFTNAPGLGGEPFLEFTTAAGVVKMGELKSVTYARGEGAEAVCALARNEAALQAVEAALLPGPGGWAERLERLQWQRKIAQWEQVNPRPAIGYVHWVEGLAPEGFVRREGLEAPAGDYARLGLGCLLSTVARDWLADRPLDLPEPL
ncbi:MAG: hypothetical protein PHE83_18415, partial [Opitutaceae bacterium]|nr:hypothetical protein [Opitutaceae bacterium]